MTGCAATQRFVSSPLPLLRVPERARFRQERSSSVSARAAALIIPEIVDPGLSVRPSLDGEVCRVFALEDFFAEIPSAMCDFRSGVWCDVQSWRVRFPVIFEGSRNASKQR